MRLRCLVRRALNPPLVLVAVLIVLFEATLWRWVTRLGAALAARIPLFSALERLVERLSPRSVCVVFVLPLSLVLPVHAAAVWLIVSRRYCLGVALLLTVKVIGTAVAARLFAIARPKLLQVPRFALCYRKVMRCIAFANRYVERLPAWRATRAAMQAARGWIRGARRGHLAHRFAAARRRVIRRSTRPSFRPASAGRGS